MDIELDVTAYETCFKKACKLEVGMDILPDSTVINKSGNSIYKIKTLQKTKKEIRMQLDSGYGYLLVSYSVALDSFEKVYLGSD